MKLQIAFKSWTAGAVLLLLLAGCSDGTQFKKETLAALAKQDQMQTYRYSGSVDLQLGLAAPDQSPLTSALYSLVKNSKLEWNGVTDLENARTEADFKLTPKGSSSPLTMPVILKDNKIYFRLPAINLDDEYYVEDLAKISTNDAAGAANPADKLKSAPRISTALAKALLNGMDAKWYKPRKSEEGATSKTFDIDITEQNAQEATTALQNGYTDFVGRLSAGGLLPGSLADKLKASDAKAIAVHSPGHLSVTIDNQGNIREEQIDLQLSVTGAKGDVTDNHFDLKQTYDEINQNPAFTKQIPEHTRSFDEVLKLLGQTKK